MEEHSLAKVAVLGCDNVPVGPGKVPERLVRRATDAQLCRMCAGGKSVGEQVDKPWAEVLVEQDFHAAGEIASRRSRAAANASTARISSVLRSGKSCSSSVSDIPPARYSSTS